MDEVEKLVPNVIDRSRNLDTPAGHVLPYSFLMMRSTKNVHTRRKAAIEYLGINKGSKYIPTIIQIVNDYIQSFKSGQIVNFSKISKLITFEIISEQILGKDYRDIKIDFEYLCPQSGTISKMSFPQFFLNLLESEFAGFINPKSKLLKFLTDSHLIEPYKTNYRNNLYLRKRLVDLVEASTDMDSMYNKQKQSGEFSTEEIIMDILTIIFGAYDTTSRSICSNLYFLKKFPRVQKKLMEEISKHKLDSLEEIPFHKLNDTLQDCDYLMYVIKETLRFDTPGPSTLPYEAYEQVDVLGVTIPKGCRFVMGTVYTHFNPKYWHSPSEYLPERFDPESELYHKPGTKEMRHHKSLNSFSSGKRKCIGQSLAYLSTKVVLTLLFTKLDYEVSEELMNREKPSFDMFSNTDLIIKIN